MKTTRSDIEDEMVERCFNEKRSNHEEKEKFSGTSLRKRQELKIQIGPFSTVTCTVHRESAGEEPLVLIEPIIRRDDCHYPDDFGSIAQEWGRACCVSSGDQLGRPQLIEPVRAALSHCRQNGKVLFEPLNWTEEPNLRYDRIRLRDCGLDNLTSVAGTDHIWTLRCVSCSGSGVEAVE
jgi:hypothetical protein